MHTQDSDTHTQYVSFLSPLIGCDNITINCSRWERCKVDETIHQAYCEPSCDLDNGGCGDDEICSLTQGICQSLPCPSKVHCNSMYCINV